MLAEFINEYGTAIMYAILTALGGYLGIVAKNLYTNYINDKTKQAVAKTVVQGVEQIYYDLHGEEKLSKALSAASEMLAEKGINVSELELRMLIEAALAEFNDAFNTDRASVYTATIAAEDLTDDQLRAVLLQMGKSPAEDATREELLALLDAEADEAAPTLGSVLRDNLTDDQLQAVALSMGLADTATREEIMDRIDAALYTE